MEICRGIIVKSPKCVKTVGCKFNAHLEAIKEADAVIAIYDPEDPLCERETAAVAVAEMLNTQVVTVDPKAIHCLW